MNINYKLLYKRITAELAPFLSFDLEGFEREVRARKLREISIILDRLYEELHLIKKFRKQDFPIESFSVFLRVFSNIFFSNLRESFIEVPWDYQVSRIISKFADFIVKIVLLYLDANDKLLVIAMGKWGGRDLNYLSDIDMIVLRPDSVSETQARNLFYEFNALLSEPTSYGICFYTDYDLRPGGKTGPILPSVSELTLSYTKNMQAWEKMAWIRARAVNFEHDIDFFLIIKKIVFSKYLDYSNIEKLKIAWNEIILFRQDSADSVDLKLNPGGIRELEFVFFSKYMLSAGRLGFEGFSQSVNELLGKLRQYKLYRESFIRELESIYYTLRALEDLLQAFYKRRGSVLQKKDLERISLFYHVKLPSWEEILSLLDKGKRVFQSIFNKEYLSVDTTVDLFRKNELLNLVNFLNLGSLEKRELESLSEFFLSKVKDANDFEKLKRFYRGIKGKKNIFSLLANNKRFASFVLELLVEGEYFSELIFKNTGALDLLFLRRNRSLNSLVLPDNLKIDNPSDLEDLRQLVLTYKLYREASLALQYKLGLIMEENLLKRLSLFTEEIIVKLSRLFIPQINVIAMGSLGSREFSFGSDLDLVFVVETLSETLLNNLRRFVNFISSPYHKDLKIYDIDIDLRPHKKGMVLTSIDAFRKFYLDEKTVWKFVALSKARLLYGEKKVMDKILDVQKDLAVFFSKLDSKEFLKDLLKVYQEYSNVFNIKYSEGGLLSIEYLSRFFALKYGILLPSVFENLELLANKENILTDFIIIYRKYLSLDLEYRLTLGTKYKGFVDEENRDYRVINLIRKLQGVV